MSTAVTPTLSVPLDPRPISAALQRHFDDLSKIQTGKTIQAGATVTTSGLEASIGVVRETKRAGTFGLQGWAGREWGGAGWLAGARATWSR